MIDEELAQNARAFPESFDTLANRLLPATIVERNLGQSDRGSVSVVPVVRLSAMSEKSGRPPMIEYLAGLQP